MMDRDQVGRFVFIAKSLAERMFEAADEMQRLAEEAEGLRTEMDVWPPCDVEPHAVELPTSPTVQGFSDVTHSVFRDGEPVYSGTRGECQCFADNHFPSGGYGIGPIQD